MTTFQPTAIIGEATPATMTFSNFLCPMRTGAYAFAGTSWAPRCEQSMAFLRGHDGAPRSSYDARMELIENADAIIKRNFEESVKCLNCAPVTDDAIGAPSATIQTCGTRTCKFEPAEFARAGGVGVERNFTLL